ncbi:MAG: hypothetical protein AAF700_12170 [Pseudomonadota bacterium]
MRLVFALLLMMLPATAHAQDEGAQPQAPIFEGLDQLADSLRNLFNEFEEDVSPFMEQLGEQLRDLDRYHPPEILPNGDIIIRRKSPEKVPAPGDQAPQDPIDI